MFNGKQLFGGILILIGLSGLFNTFGFGQYWDILWPLLLLAAGIYMYLNKRRTGGILLILLGILFFASNVLSTNALRLFFPLLFIYIGASVFGILPKFGSRRTDSKGEPVSSDMLDDFVIFGGSEKTIKSDDFKGGEIVSVFGAVKLYFDEAKISKDGANLNITAIFGGAEVIVPKNMSVTSQGDGVFGGWEDKTVTTKTKRSGGELRLTGEAIFGSVVIRN